MNKSEVLDAVSAAAGVPKATADSVVSALISTITAGLAKGESVAFVGFGTFKTSKRAARTGKNPKTGAALKIKATTVAKFTAGASLKEAVATGKVKSSSAAGTKKPAAKKKVAAKPVAAKKAK